MISFKKLLAMGLSLTMVLGLASCGKKEAESSTDAISPDSVYEELVPDYIYVPEYLTTEENSSFYNTFLYGNKLYANTYHFDELTEEGASGITCYELTGNCLENGRTILNFSNDISVDHYYLDPQEQLFAIESVIDREGVDEEDFNPSREYFLVKYDQQGNEVFRTSLSDLAGDAEWFYVQNMVVDAQGKSYLNVEGGQIAIYDEQGAFAGTITVDGVDWIDKMGVGKDGKAYICYYNYSGGASEYKLAELDGEKKQVGKTYDNFIGGNGTNILQASADGCFLASNETGMYEYSLEKQEATKLFSWLDSDINSNYVNGYFAMENGKILVVITDWDSGTTELALLTKTKADEVQRAQTIVLGTFYQDSALSAAAVEFNKSNGKYRVIIKSYIDPNSWSDTSYEDAITQMNNEMIAGKAPDIMDISNLDVQNLVAKGLIEDLTPYLEKSSTLSKDMFFDQVLDACTVNQVLTCIPSSLTLETLMAKATDVGGKNGWTIADIMAYAKAHPNGELLAYADKPYVLSRMLNMNKSQYIDQEKAECYFDTQDFKDLLQFANTFPDVYDYENADNRLEPFRLADGSLLLLNAYIYDFSSVQSNIAYFGGEPVTCIGYPNNSGKNGCIMNFSDRYAIMAKATQKEGCWEFLEFLLNREVLNNWMFSGFSTRKDIFEKQKEKAMEVQYVLDENGEPYLDEEGNPVLMNGGGWSMMDDYGNEWQFENKPLSETEAGLVEQLIRGAICADQGFDSELLNIIQEEAGSFFSGNKSVDEAAGIIQNRISLYLKENQ